MCGGICRGCAGGEVGPGRIAASLSLLCCVCVLCDVKRAAGVCLTCAPNIEACAEVWPCCFVHQNVAAVNQENNLICLIHSFVVANAALSLQEGGTSPTCSTKVVTYDTRTL